MAESTQQDIDPLVRIKREFDAHHVLDTEDGAWLISEVDLLRLANANLLDRVQQLIDQHGTFPYMGYKSELKGL